MLNTILTFIFGFITFLPFLVIVLIIILIIYSFFAGKEQRPPDVYSLSDI